MADNGSILPVSGAGYGWLSDLFYRAWNGTISNSERDRIATQTGKDVAKAGGTAAQVTAAENEVKNFVNQFWKGSSWGPVVLGVVAVALFAAFLIPAAGSSVGRRRRRSRSAAGQGSGVVAGVAAAALAWFFWSQYLKTGHVIGTSSILPGEISQSFGGPSVAETTSGPLDLPNWIPLDTSFSWGS